MRAPFLLIFLSGFFCASAQYVGPPNNVGREYGNPKMPLMVSHLAGANKERLKRAVKNSRHSIFGKVLCFRKLCRIQSGHPASLRSISFKKFRKKVARNAKKGLYKKAHNDSTYKRSTVHEVMPAITDTTTAKPPSANRADSLIVLNAELLFETDKSMLRREHFATLNSIVDYLMLHPGRSVKISGHTDNTGSEQHNLTLSKRRADVVAEYLVNNGVDINRVETSGLGSAMPLEKNTTDEGRRKNRRVELLIQDRQ
jgi:outer membrane protein OmpA-like peptidoglycan-associated protein